MSDYTKSENREYWEERAGFHLETPLYQRFVAQLKAGGDSLLPLEREELGPLDGLRVLHLQCHVGTDTLSLVRRGAARAVGVDFAETAIAKARELAAELEIDAEFVHAELDELPAEFDASFDLVFTSYGAICWLRDLQSWASTISRCLTPGGRFYIVDSHPLSLALDENCDAATGELKLRFPYLPQPVPLRFEAEGSYADAGAATEHNVTLEWSHGLGTVLAALTDAGLSLDYLREHADGYFEVVKGMERGADGHWRLPAPLHGRYPLTFSLSARRSVTNP